MKKILLPVLLSFTMIHVLSAQNFNMQFRSEVTYPYSCASIWGYFDSHNEYALVGTYKGVSIVDVTDPDNPAILFNVVHTNAQSEWREIKSYGHYAYATNETGSGLLIIDLADLPNSYTKYTFEYTDVQGNTQSNGHTLWIDEHGRLYIFGGNYGNGGATMFDLTVDPINPPFVGKYESHYIHDAFVRGDTMWASEIYDGQVEVVDVSNPSAPVPLASWTTPSNFAHNSWPTHDDHYSFTTDEVDNSYLTSYDVSDLSNITELDRAQSNPGSGTIIHNVHLLNDQFAVVAYYKDGVVLFDVSHPDNMIECGSYDTDPGESGGEYGGTWGVYPYLPSGNIIASDLSDAGAVGGKLTVLTPTYVAASWLVGNVTDSLSGAPLNNAYAEVEATQNTDYSDLSGNYKTGNGIPGTYTVRFSKLGYVTKEIPNVVLTSGVQTSLNVQLVSVATINITGQVLDSVSNVPIQGATVYFSGNAGYQYTVTTDASGNFTTLVGPDTYNIYCGKWTYHESGLTGTTINSNSGPIQFKLKKGYYDDFIFDFEWTENHTSTTGFWTRCEPIGTYNNATPINPENDITGDWGDQCYVTGNGGGDIGTDDVDDGYTTITSPLIDLSSYSDAVVKFYGWFANTGGQGNPNDTMDVYITDGVNTVLVMQINKNNFPQSQWNYHEFHVNSYIVPNSTMRVEFKAIDQPQGHVTEAGIDYFRIDGALGDEVSSVTTDGGKLNAFPNPFTNSETISYQLNNISTDARMEVLDVHGNKVESHTVNSANGSFTFGKELAQGIYMIHLVENNKTIGILKVVKQN